MHVVDFEHGAAVKEWRGHKREVNRLALLQVILREPHAPNLEKQARTLNVASECCLAVRIAGAHHRCARRPGDDIQSCCLCLKIRALTASCEDQNANTRYAADGASSLQVACQHCARETAADSVSPGVSMRCRLLKVHGVVSGWVGQWADWQRLEDSGLIASGCCDTYPPTDWQRLARHVLPYNT